MKSIESSILFPQRSYNCGIVNLARVARDLKFTMFNWNSEVYSVKEFNRMLDESDENDLTEIKRSSFLFELITV